MATAWDVVQHVALPGATTSICFDPTRLTPRVRNSCARMVETLVLDGSYRSGAMKLAEMLLKMQDENVRYLWRYTDRIYYDKLNASERIQLHECAKARLKVRFAALDISDKLTDSDKVSQARNDAEWAQGYVSEFVFKPAEGTTKIYQQCLAHSDIPHCDLAEVMQQSCVDQADVIERALAMLHSTTPIDLAAYTRDTAKRTFVRTSNFDRQGIQP